MKRFQFDSSTHRLSTACYLDDSFPILKRYFEWAIIPATYYIDHNESSHLTRGPGSGLLSLLFWPLSMMLIVAPLRQREVSFEPQIMLYYQVPDLPDFVDLAAPLPNDRSNHVVGDRHLMPGFWFSIQRYQKNRNFYI